MKEEEVQKLSNIDEYLLRSILGLPSKTAKEALFLETGCLPIKYLLKMRRIMYLHHILKRPKIELIRKFYEAQKCKTSKGDWVKIVKEDMNEINLEMNDLQISQMSKQKFKKKLKKKITIAAFNYLMEIKGSHSKMSEVDYNELQIQSYLKSDSYLTNDQKQILLKLRTRMYSVRENFKNQYESKLCQLCKTEKDDQPHLFMCQKLILNCKFLAENTKVEYEDIFGSKSQQVNAAKLLEKILETREMLLNKSE